MGIFDFLSRIIPGRRGEKPLAKTHALRSPAGSLILSLRPPAAGCFSPLEVRVGESYILGEARVQAGPAPWWPFFDYLVDPASGGLAGVSYAIFDPAVEEDAVRSLCEAFDPRLASYGISPSEALALLEGKESRPVQDRSSAAPRRFPDDLFPFRRSIMEFMMGRLDRLSLPESVRERAAALYSDDISRIQRDGERGHRVEILWSPLPDNDFGVGVWGCTNLDFVRASDFANDSWLYVDADPIPLGVAFDLRGACESSSVPGVLANLDLPEVRFDLPTPTSGK